MTSVPPADSLFSTLKAENEPWLRDVFVSLPVFARLKEEHSVILYGAAGSGKTTLRLALKNQLDDKVFHALWMPEPLLETPAAGTTLAQQAIKQTLRACVENLILESKLPQRLGEPASPIASALQWFLQNHLPFDANFYLQSQAALLSQETLQWYRRLLEQAYPAVITAQTSLKDQITLLLLILRAAGYERLWLTMDGLERWIPRRAGEQVEALLEAVLSTLLFFDLPGVTFKFFVPASLENLLHKTSGVERHRAMELHLQWSAEDLQAMLEKRLTYTLAPKKGTLDLLCEGETFLNWLKEFGGVSPRAWLQFTAPLVAEYQKRGRKLTPIQTHEFVHQHPAPLRLDHERREVWLGQKCISIGSAPEFRVLECLAAGKIRSLEELYYYAYKQLQAPPDQGEHDWVPPKTWRGAMDTLIWRLRQKIEPNPSKPTYLTTHHGKGLELLHTQA